MERFDILLYTSQEEFDCEAATRDGYNMTRAEIAAEVHDFELEYQAYMVQNQGRLILVVTPSEGSLEERGKRRRREEEVARIIRKSPFLTAKEVEEKTAEKRARAHEALACPFPPPGRLTHRKPLVSPGPDHNPVGWKPETDIPDGNRLESIREPIQATLAHLDRVMQARAQIGPLPPTFAMVPPIEAAVYLAVPQRGSEDLLWRRVVTQQFSGDVTDTSLLTWLDSVQDMYGFGPEEIFYVRDWPSFEIEQEDRLQPRLSEYELDLLERRGV